MRAIDALREKHGFTVIEDASHAVGAEYAGKRVGACEHSDMTVFSFHPVKIVTTGEGGMILTNRDDLHEKLLRLRSHGITRDPAQMPTPPDGPWYYAQTELGFNYRITDIQAALGASQLQRLPEFIRRRRELAARYDGLLKGLPLTLPRQSGEGKSAWHLYVVRVDGARARKGRAEVFADLRRAGIGVNVHYIPVHTQPYYRGLGFRAGDFPEAEKYYAEAISLPMFSSLTESDQDRVVAALRSSLA
jgi:dTDP-4-amino-4,6-dideoxygalactose transaminase